MSMQPSFQSKDWNPFSAAASFIGSLGKSKESVHYQRAMLHQAANHAATTEAAAQQHVYGQQAAEQQHKLGEKALNAASRRRIAEGKAQVQDRGADFTLGHDAAKTGGGSFVVGSTSGNFPKPPKPTASVQPTGRVPVKRNRGGKKVP